MPLKKSSSVLLALLFASSLSACGGRVRITDTEWCGNGPDGGAVCFHTLSDRWRSLPQTEWDIERVGQICSTADTFAEWKAALLKLCEQTGSCDFQVQEAIRTFGNKAAWVSREARR